MFNINSKFCSKLDNGHAWTKEFFFPPNFVILKYFFVDPWFYLSWAKEL